MTTDTEMEETTRFCVDCGKEVDISLFNSGKKRSLCKMHFNMKKNAARTKTTKTTKPSKASSSEDEAPQEEYEQRLEEDAAVVEARRAADRAFRDKEALRERLNRQYRKFQAIKCESNPSWTEYPKRSECNQLINKRKADRVGLNLTAEAEVQAFIEDWKIEEDYMRGWMVSLSPENRAHMEQFFKDRVTYRVLNGEMGARLTSRC